MTTAPNGFFSPKFQALSHNSPKSHMVSDVTALTPRPRISFCCVISDVVTKIPEESNLGEKCYPACNSQFESIIQRKSAWQEPAVPGFVTSTAKIREQMHTCLVLSLISLLTVQGPNQGIVLPVVACVFPYQVIIKFPRDMCIGLI